MTLSGKSILLGVSGGIAAYKSVLLLRELQKAGADVRVTMTPAATRFVGVETFATLSRHEVGIQVFQDGTPGDAWARHIHWAEWADLFLIAPCTANTLAKITHGLSDNLLTALALAARSPLLICPTMDGDMIRHPAVRQNLETARSHGHHILMPEAGYLASGLEGEGRLPETDVILQKIQYLLAEGDTNDNGRPLAGKTVLVTAGPTREPIDAVRFISNPSSGKMGIAMAEAAQKLGADVLLLHGPLTTSLPPHLRSIRFETAEELFELVKSHRERDLVIMAAAVSDFRPATVHPGKQKKERGLRKLELTRNPDILEWLGQQKESGQTLIGFAMETESLEANARKKLEAKNLDWICANDLSEPDAGFQSDRNRIRLIGRDKKASREFTGAKRAIAQQILRTIFSNDQ